MPQVSSVVFKLRPQDKIEGLFIMMLLLGDVKFYNTNVSDCERSILNKLRSVLMLNES
jgi:hypothetical protein